jgi:hypothetical protein
VLRGLLRGHFLQVIIDTRKKWGGCGNHFGGSSSTNPDLSSTLRSRKRLICFFQPSSKLSSIVGVFFLSVISWRVFFYFGHFHKLVLVGSGHPFKLLPPEEVVGEYKV